MRCEVSNMFLDLFKLAFKNVGKRKKRAALTMLGVFIGIAAVVALISLGQGLQQTINEQFEKVGGDKIIVQAKELGFTGQNAPGALTEDEVDIAEDVVGVKEAAGALFRTGQIRFKDVQRTMFLIGVPDDARDVDLLNEFNTWEIGQGRLLSHKDSGKAVIGSTVAENRFGREVRIGDKLEIDEEKFEVVGILKRMGDPGIDGGVALAEEDIRRVLNDTESFSYIVAQSAQGEDPEDIAKDITKDIRRDRGLDEGKEDFTVQTATDLIASFNAVLNIIQAVFLGIAAISLLVGGIGIMNTMYTAVLERTREIGVMKAIGAKNSDVLAVFLIESGLLGVAGGIIGIVIGFGISKSVEVFVNASFGAGTLHAIMPWYLIAGALTFSFVVGAASGYLPAKQASSLKPVDALRYE